MTENEAIKEFRENIELPFGSSISNEASEMAISALEEIQQYRALGMVEEIEPYIRLAEKMNLCDLVKENASVYNKLRSVEIELREAMEKQRPKKMKDRCPDCGTPIKRCYFNCPGCGQAIENEKEDNINESE